MIRLGSQLILASQACWPPNNRSIKLRDWGQLVRWPSLWRKEAMQRFLLCLKIWKKSPSLLRIRKNCPSVCTVENRALIRQKHWLKIGWKGMPVKCHSLWRRRNFSRRTIRNVLIWDCRWILPRSPMGYPIGDMRMLLNLWFWVNLLQLSNLLNLLNLLNFH